MERRHSYGAHPPFGSSYLGQPAEPEPAAQPEEITTAGILVQFRKELTESIGEHYVVDELVLAAGKALFENGITVKNPNTKEDSAP